MNRQLDFDRNIVHTQNDYNLMEYSWTYILILTYISQDNFILF